MNHNYVPFRRFYPSGKRREITKSEHLAFMKAVDTIMADYSLLDDVGNGGWNIETDYGVLRVHRGLDDSYGYAYDINSAFQDSTQYPKIEERFGRQAFNNHSGKWNILQFEGDDAIDILKDRLEMVGAKKLVAIPA